MSADAAPGGRSPRHRAPSRAATRRAIIYMLLGFFFFGIADLLGKILTQELNPFQVAWVRQIGLVAGIVVIIGFKGFAILRTRHPILQFGRGLCVVMATAGFLASIRYLP